MKNNKAKKIFKIIFFFLTIFLFLGILLKFFLKPANLELSFLDVGQGDACLLELPSGEIILIDGGPDNLVLRRLGEELPFYRRRLYLVIISHFHQDHVAGLIEIFRRYRVDNLVYGAGLETSLYGDILLAEAKKQKTNIFSIEKSIIFQFKNNCRLDIFNPLYFYSPVNSNNSLFNKLVCNNFSFLSAGDNEKTAEDALLSSRLDLSARIFKASHHGAKTSNSQEFLKMINPEIMVISVGADNHLNHPSPEVIETAIDLDIELRRTDEEGTVNILVDIEFEN
jgi:competence protein ComEC